MTALSVSAVVGLVVLTSVASTIPLCLGRGWIRRARRTAVDASLEVAPYVGLLALVFLARRLVHEESVALSRDVGRNITDVLFAIEGYFVAGLQTLTPDLLVHVFAGFYVFGFTYLLVVPVVLYTAVSATRPLKELLVAYALNDVLGMVLYTLFVAYGPRLHIGGHVDGLLYDLYPQVQLLTGAVSANTNVFPSLHTSLSVVVLVFAWRTRQDVPRWFTIAAICTLSIVLSTMVLGIHWLTDVVAGVILAYGCVAMAGWIVSAAESHLLADWGPSLTHTSQSADD
jgi:membrane-associated phospholipid phosphatase